MYVVKCDGEVIHSVLLKNEGIILTAGNAEIEANKSGSFIFDIAKNNPKYDDVKAFSEIGVYEDDEEIFFGRAISNEYNFHNTKTVTCEGELSYLLDSILNPYSYSGSVSGYFQMLLNSHNNNVDSHKQFRVGNVTVSDPNNYIVRSNQEHANTLDELTDKLLDTSLGGYLKIRKVSGIKYLDYLTEFNNDSAKHIEFAINMIDYNKFVTGENVFTRLIPLGAKDENTGRRITIESVNNGVNYLQNNLAGLGCGIISKTMVWDDVTIPANLLTKARVCLGSNLDVSYSITAVDMHMLDNTIGAVKIGDKVSIKSPIHELDGSEEFTCLKRSIDIITPSNNTFTLGKTLKTLTEMKA